MPTVLAKKFNVLEKLHKQRILFMKRSCDPNEMNQNAKLVYLSYTTKLNTGFAPVVYFNVTFFPYHFPNPRYYWERV